MSNHGITKPDSVEPGDHMMAKYLPQPDALEPGKICKGLLPGPTRHVGVLRWSLWVIKVTKSMQLVGPTDRQDTWRGSKCNNEVELADLLAPWHDPVEFRCFSLVMALTGQVCRGQVLLLALVC